MECIFCKISCSNDINDSILYENDGYYIIPAKGPIVTGHILIVSKSHDLSLMCLGYKKKEQFIEIINFIKSFRAYSNFLLFEHGSYKSSKGGKTIDHTHIHIIPNFRTYKNILHDEYKFKLEINIKEISHKDLYFPYLMIGDEESIIIYNGKDVKSQIIRIKIAERTPNFSASWKENRNMEAVMKTIKIWKDVKI